MNQDFNEFNQNNSNKQSNNNISQTNSTLNISENNMNNSINNNQVEANNINSNKLKNSEPENKNILKKIFIVLSIIAVILCIISGIYLINTALNIPNEGDLSSLFSGMLIFVGVGLIFYTGTVVGIIWLFYEIIKLISNFLKKQYKTNKKKFKKGLIIGVFLLLLLAFPIKKFYDKLSLKVLDIPPSYEFYDDTSYYFIYEDKIYYYKRDHKGDVTKSYESLYVMNLDGTNKKKIFETNELKLVSFSFVYNDEAYFTTLFCGAKKINLKTGEVTSLGEKEFYLAKTLNNGFVYTFYDSNNVADEYVLLKKINLKTNETISEIKTTHYISNENLFFDYDGCNIYYLEDYKLEHPHIYKNNDSIYEFIEYDNYNFPKIEFIALNNDYIYFKQTNDIYKLNINNKSIDKKFSNKLGDFKRISSGNNSDNYFYSNKNIYYFDMEKDTFELLISNIEKQPEYIYNINNNLIFTENTDNIKISYTDNLGTVVIYNKLSGNVEIYDNIRKVSFDEKYMYLLYQPFINYSVKKIELYS